MSRRDLAQPARGASPLCATSALNESARDHALEVTVHLLSAMAHAARLRMLLALSRGGALSAGDLVVASRLEQSAASHQLKVLREARLVSCQREGKRMIYRLADSHVAQIVEDALAHASEGVPGAPEAAG